MALALFCADTAERHPLVNRAVVADFRRLADYDTGSVINQDALAEPCPRMNLNQRHEARKLGNEARNEIVLVFPEPVRNAVGNQRMHPLIQKQHLKKTARRRISVLRCADIRNDIAKQHNSLTSPIRGAREAPLRCRPPGRYPQYSSHTLPILCRARPSRCDARRYSETS